MHTATTMCWVYNLRTTTSYNFNIWHCICWHIWYHLKCYTYMYMSVYILTHANRTMTALWHWTYTLVYDNPGETHLPHEGHECLHACLAASQPRHCQNPSCMSWANVFYSHKHKSDLEAFTATTWAETSSGSVEVASFYQSTCGLLWRQHSTSQQERRQLAEPQHDKKAFLKY